MLDPKKKLRWFYKNMPGDVEEVKKLFYDTVRGQYLYFCTAC